MKKYIALLLAAMMVLACVAGCGNNNTEQPDNNDQPSNTDPTPSTPTDPTTAVNMRMSRSITLLIPLRSRP